MKTIYFTVSALLIINSVMSQNIEAAKKEMYYERNESAKKILLGIVNNSPIDPDAVYWLGKIYLQQNKLDSAYQLYNTKAGMFLQQEYNKKQSPLLYAGWAHVLLDSGKTTEAKIQFDNILKETKNKNAMALWAVAKANIDSKNGNLPYAIELLQAAVKRDKKNPALYNTLGDAYRKSVDGSNAVRSYDMALDLDPVNAEAMYKKGKIYRTQNNPEIYMDRFKQAYTFDSTYTPVLYELYNYYFYKDVYYAEIYLNKYLATADHDPQHAYMKADIFYLSKKYNEAIDKAKQIIYNEGDSAEPRLYKLMAYSYAALGDSVAALKNTTSYFEKEDTANYVAKDFVLKAELLEKLSADTSQVILLYKKALAIEKEQENKTGYLTSLVRLANAAGNAEEEATWRGELYNSKTNPSNLDLYNWGLSLYQNNDFEKADSVFAIYQEKYPEQVYGSLYRARSNTFIDSTMEKGLAVPHYKQLIEVAGKDEERNKRLLLLAYEYLGAYEANVTKQYAASLAYFNKLLTLDPGNEEAEKNTALIKKWMDAEEKNN